MVPSGEIEANLAIQNARHRDKAEKVAKNLIKAGIKAQEKAKKKAKPPASRKRKAQCSDESDKEEYHGEFDPTEIIREAEMRQKKIDDVLVEHMAKIKIPDYIGITKLASAQEKQSRSSRGLLIQAALKEAERLEGKISEGDSRIAEHCITTASWRSSMLRRPQQEM